MFQILFFILKIIYIKIKKNTKKIIKKIQNLNCYPVLKPYKLYLRKFIPNYLTSKKVKKNVKPKLIELWHSKCQSLLTSLQ